MLLKLILTEVLFYVKIMTYYTSLTVFLLVANASRSAAAGCGASGSSNGEEKAGKAEGDAGPSCSSLSKDAGDAKSRFFDDSEESEEGEEEEGSDEEVRAPPEQTSPGGCEGSLARLDAGDT